MYIIILALFRKKYRIEMEELMVLKRDFLKAEQLRKKLVIQGIFWMAR